MVAVRQRNDSVGRLFDTLDQIGVEEEFALVEPCQFYHDTRLPT